MKLFLFCLTVFGVFFSTMFFCGVIYGYLVLAAALERNPGLLGPPFILSCMIAGIAGPLVWFNHVLPKLREKKILEEK